VEAVKIIGYRSLSLGFLPLVSAMRRASRWRGPAVHRALLPSILLSCLLSSTAIYSLAQPAHPTESQVKAAYLYNFGKFVRWQADRVSSPGSLEICVLGKDPFGTVLDSTIAGESIEGRKITVGRIARVQDAEPCSILFISTSEASRLGSILTAAQHLSALTVSDLPHFVEQGGMIGFVMQDGRIRFDVNRAAAEQSHLILSSELLKVATKVIEKPSPGN
jgi:hypothetical protein